MYLLVILFIIALDQVTKLLALKSFQQGIYTEVIDGFFYFTCFPHIGNSISINYRIIISAICMLFFQYLFIHSKNVLKVSLCFILAGTISNFAERILKGAVIDFLAFRISNKELILNFADTFLFVGVFISVYCLIVECRKSNTYMVDK